MDNRIIPCVRARSGRRSVWPKAVAISVLVALTSAACGDDNHNNKTSAALPGQPQASSTPAAGSPKPPAARAPGDPPGSPSAAPTAEAPGAAAAPAAGAAGSTPAGAK